jgi:hypothetical protein
MQKYREGPSTIFCHPDLGATMLIHSINKALNLVSDGYTW